MLAASFTSPTAAPQYSAAAAYYSQPNTSIAYGQVSHGSDGGNRILRGRYVRYLL